VLSWRRKALSRRWVAIAAAYLLVLQAIFAGLSSAAYAASVSLDRELALTLCAPSNTAPARTDHGGAATHVDQSCCTLGCPMSAGGQPPEANFEPVVHRAADQVAFSKRFDRPSGFLAGRSPANPRAPPAEI
jgi:hypothetical protein